MFKLKLKCCLFQPSLCRKISCPVGQIRNQDGHCVFFSNRVFYNGRSRFTANVILRPVKHDAFVDTENITVNQVADALGELSDWKIMFYGIATDKMKNNAKQRGELLVRMALTTPDIVEVLETLKLLFGRSPVTLSDGTIAHNFSVGLYPINLPFGPNKNNTIFSKKFCSKENSAIWNNVVDFSICWHLLFDNSVLAFLSTQVNKMYFCNLVELLPEDFQLLANDSIMYFELGQRYFYETEFFIIEGEDRNKRAKICLEDSGLIPFDENAGVKYVCHTSMVITVLLPIFQTIANF